MDNLKIGIVGGSLGGLFAGHALRKAGFEVDIFERNAGGVNTRGAGIVFQPDLADYLRQNEIVTPENISTTCRHRKFYNQDGSLSHSDPAYQEFVSWEALYKNLRRVTPAENYHEGFSLDSFEEEGEQVSLHFDNGEKRHVDLMVSADGVHSETRRHLLKGKEPSYAGYIAWRGVIDESDLSSDTLQALDETFSFCHIPNSHFLTYFIPGDGASIEKGKRRLNWVWYKNVSKGEELDYFMTDKNGKHHRFSIGEGLLRPELHKTFYSMSENELPPLFSGLCAKTKNPFLQPILDMNIDQMVFGRVVLIGDAAFVVRPHTAASTYKAAIDGISLASHLEGEGSISSALQKWERIELRLGKQLVSSGQSTGNRSQFGR